MKTVTIEATQWQDPLLAHKRLVSVFEPLSEAPVSVLIREDVFDRVRDLFEVEEQSTYLTEAWVAFLKESIATRFSVESFHRTTYWQLSESMLPTARACPTVRRLAVHDLDALQKAVSIDDLSSSPEGFLGFGGGYGYFVDDSVVSWANIDDIDSVSSGIGNVYTLRGERGKGYATAVVSACMREILARGRTGVSSTDRDNIPMNAIFRKLGFRKIAEDFVVIEVKD